MVYSYQYTGIPIPAYRYTTIPVPVHRYNDTSILVYQYQRTRSSGNVRSSFEQKHNCPPRQKQEKCDDAMLASAIGKPSRT